VKHKTDEVKHKIEVERHLTENEVPRIKVCDTAAARIKVCVDDTAAARIKVCVDNTAADFKNETEIFYKPANIANALLVVYKQFNYPVYSDYSRGHCYEIV
jgi:hypothetical protein